MPTISSRQFNQDVSAAKRAATDGPVVITDRGEPAFVLLTIDEYRRLDEPRVDIVHRLSMEDEIEIEFDAVSLDLKHPEL
ncbi:type II toxin-antitoxin system prevent-host-death family antitoxin [Brachybacterium endophyticum]|uniref:Antitoxin n=1 Tax=Brachybacterium endophyticum TaxID=2182385 RepID=A0A2U2RJH9_9MICO|nr:type II toxin-antitoxin system Phd/YefM family antitoxin [Brachybacterium endophyticum]PWH05991.1 type II toxin-antitoxin system prevent-host-death family antitoxin [Brachybacterium endophyticum]